MLEERKVEGRSTLSAWRAQHGGDEDEDYGFFDGPVSIRVRRRTYRLNPCVMIQAATLVLFVLCIGALLWQMRKV